MNNILDLSVKFQNSKRNGTGGSAPHLPSNKSYKIEHIIELIKELHDIIDFWSDNKEYIPNVLVNVHYIKIVPKSSRISQLFNEINKEPNESIVGAKFEIDSNKKNHVMTHCLAFETLEKSIKELQECFRLVENIGVEDVTNEVLIKIKDKKDLKSFLSKTKILKLLVDCFFVRKLDVVKSIPELNDSRIVILYNTGIELEKLFSKLGIPFNKENLIDENTLYVTVGQYEILRNKVPYLVAMSTSDLTDIPSENVDYDLYTDEQIPDPTNEPIIGVIDTLFDESVYFSKWVTYKQMVQSNTPIDYRKSYIHGTSVSSIIVDGPRLNPKLDDGCGRFRVRHFGVAIGDRYSATLIYKYIKEIVLNNLDIKVWNLSLGSSQEIDDNYISPIGALLDKLQYEHDIIFVVAGTNKMENGKPNKIGSPADSINSLVVNSVNFNNEPASYSRQGPVLSFFTKPDVCYYGGEGFNGINVGTANGTLMKSGTSFASPWIARKLAYLIQILGLPREVAKALIIDSAAGWKEKGYSSNIIGYGVVPQKISEIVQSNDDEIRFFMYGESEKYNTYSYRIPVPKSADKYPYISKATLCYFPKCSRLQGVDYTCTEFDFHFGRLSSNGQIISINDNKQNESSGGFYTEDEARDTFRKWDNVKFIGEYDTTRKQAKKVYADKNWGIKILTTERLNEKNGKNLRFGVVITLKDLEGKNRIDQFIQQCEINNIFVTPISINNKVEVYQKAQTDIVFN